MAYRENSYRSLLDQPQYIKLMFANAVERFGDSLDVITFSWVMYQVTGNASLIALIMAFNYIPTILFQPFTGVLADSLPQKRTMILCDFGRAGTACVTAVLFLSGQLQSWALFPLTFLISTIEAFRMPAGSALIPKVLDKEKYKLGTALNQTLRRVMEAVGSACAGGIIAVMGCPAALFMDAGCFIASACLISLIKNNEIKSNSIYHVKQYIDNLKEGFQYLKTSRLLIWLIILGAAINFVCVPYSAFQSVFIGSTLKMGPEVLSAVGVVMTVGMGLGAYLTPFLGKFARGKTLLFASGIASALFYVALWLVPNLYLMPQRMLLLLIGCGIYGIATGLQSVIFGTAFITNVKQDLMGRLNGICNAVMQSIMPIGSLICSTLAAFLSVPQIFLITAIMLLLMSVAMKFIKEYDNL